MKHWLILFFFLAISSAYALPNPASVHCIHQGGELRLMNEAAGTIGVCIFPDQSYCEEWSYLRNTCKPGEYFLPEKKSGTKYCFIKLANKNLIIHLCKE